jgi:hypothetical protein
MNLQQMRKNLGRHLHLRPIPHRVSDAGKRLPDIDDAWRLDAIMGDPQRLRLVNTSTHHVVELQPDNVREYRSPHFLVLRCQLIISSRDIQIEPLVPAAVLPGTESVAAGAVRRSYNVPPGYEQKLNRFRFQIARDTTARTSDGKYSFPVEFLAAKQDMEAFLDVTGGRSTGEAALAQEPGGKVRLKAIYSGALSPTDLEKLAIAHRLQVIRCWPNVTM